MIVSKKMQLQKFEAVFIPSKKDLYQKFGFRRIPNSGSTNVDDMTTPVNLQDRVDKIGAISYGAYLIKQEHEDRARAAAVAAEQAEPKPSSSDGSSE